MLYVLILFQPIYIKCGLKQLFFRGYEDEVSILHRHCVLFDSRLAV